MKISITDTSIRLPAGAGASTAAAEAKLANEMQAVNNQSFASGAPLVPDASAEMPQGSSNAVLHLGPQTHTAITLQAAQQSVNPAG